MAALIKKGKRGLVSSKIPPSSGPITAPPFKAKFKYKKDFFLNSGFFSREKNAKAEGS